MEVSNVFTCPCRPGFTYKSLTQHKKSKMHQSWETSREVKDVRVQSKQFENEIERLKNRLEHKESIEIELLNIIRQLESDIEYWKKSCEGVYI